MSEPTKTVTLELNRFEVIVLKSWLRGAMEMLDVCGDPEAEALEQAGCSDKPVVVCNGLARKIEDALKVP
jgi:hypothetical protein